MQLNHAGGGLLLLSLFTSYAAAFFPVSEVSDTVHHGSSLFSEHFHHGPASRDVKGKRDDKTQKTPSIFISIAPFRSGTRYAIRNAPPPPTRSVPFDKRENQYKFASANPVSQPSSAPVNEDGTDYSYFSQIGIGSKDTEMYMLLDTGSALTWVMSDECKSGPCSIHNLFGPSSGSTTLQTGDQTFDLDYGSGEISGKMGNDTLSFAGLKVTVPLGLATDVSDDFQNYPFDGILGLGRVPINGNPTVTFLQELINTKALSSNIFGVNLQRNSDGTNDGEINFAAPDTSKYQGDLHWVDTTDDHTFWEIGVDDMAVDGKEVGFGGKTAVLDTGTSYMMLPPDDAKTFFSKVEGASSSDGQNFFLPCDTSKTIQVVISGVGFDISPKDYVGASSGKNDGQCVSHILGLDAVGDGKTWLLGDTFLKNVYSVFDFDKNRVGFGAKTGSSVFDKQAASSSGDSSHTGTSSGSSSSSSGPSSSGSSSSGSSSSSSGSSGPASPSATGALGLPGGGSKTGAASPAASSSGGAAPTGSDAKKSGATSSNSFSVESKMLLIAAVAGMSWLLS